MKNILLIDDDQAFRTLVIPALEAKGHRVLQAANGFAAERIISDYLVDLIIVDGHLDDVDGEQWIADRRAEGVNTPMVFISGYWRSPEAYARLTDELDVAQIVHKPVLPIGFSEQIDQLLSFEPEMSPEDASLERALAEIRAAYIHTLPTETQALVDLLAEAKANPDDIDSLNKVKSLAHKLRGTAGSYGLLQLSNLFGSVEEMIVEIVRANSKPTIRDWSSLTYYVMEGHALAKSAAEQWPGAQSEARQLEAVPRETANARILMVDDDPAFLRLIQEIGNQRLVNVIPATTIPEAIEAARNFDLDAAIIDANLGEPEISLQCAAELRNLAGNETLPLAFISGGHGQIANRIAAAHAGASLFLEKPIGPDALEAAVQHLVAIRQGTKARVLVVDDDPMFIRQVATVLEFAGMTVQSLTQTAPILQVLEEFRPDVVLLDVMMPGISGYDICRMLKTQPRWQDTPILFITAQSGWETRVATFQAGGDDYLSKPVVSEELLARVKVRVERSRLLRDRADKDAITGLLLRRAFMTELSARMSSAMNNGGIVTIAMIDLDHFKKVNDTNGHLSGDGVLAGIGRLFLRRFRTEDLRGRWGGEEFILAFSDEDPDTVCGAIQTALDEFKEIPFPAERGGSIHVTFSAGIASFPADGESPYELIKVADRRLYKAKDSGRCCIITGD